MKYALQMDLYSDFLISSPNVVSARLVSEVLNKAYSHDSFTRMLAQSELDAKTYWKAIKPSIRQLESPNGIISVDDTIEKKPHSEENELISWHFDHTQGVSIKGINIVTFTYTNPDLETPVKLPVAFELVRKDSFQTKIVKKEGKIEEKTSRCASISKNELLCHRLNALVFKNFVRFRTVVFDTWYSSADNIRYIVEVLQKQVVCAVKSNRMMTLDLQKHPKEQKWQTVSDANLEPHKAYKVRLKDIPFDLLLVKKVYHNLNGSVGVQYLVATDTTLTASNVSEDYKFRWSSEDLHKSLKQNTALEKMPAKLENSQANHIFAAMVAQVKLEMMKFATKVNHYTLKRNIMVQALKHAWDEIQNLKERFLKKNIVFPNFETA
jgi:DDE superfamily endonuclease